MFPYFEILGMPFYSYPLLMGAAWGLGIQIVKSLDATNQIKFSRLNLYLLGVFLFSWAGAKVFYLATADFQGKQSALDSANFWLGGGFVFYGGLVFGLLFTLLFALKTKKVLSQFNIFIPALAVGHGVGRIGCFLAGCCFGAPYEGIGAIHLHGYDRYPTQLMEASALLAFGFFAMARKRQSDRFLAFQYLCFYSVLRFCLEFLRGDGVRGIWSFGISTSQIVSICVAAGLLLIWGYKRLIRARVS